MDVLRNIGMDTVQCESPKQAISPSPLDTLKRTKIQLEAKLKDVDEAIAALEAHPEIEKVITLLGKAIRY